MTSQGHEGAGTLVDLLRQQAAEQPDAEVFAAFADEPREHPGLTFRELDRQARAIAAALQRAGVAPGDRALLFYPPGAAMIPTLFGCLYAGVIAAAAPSLRDGDCPGSWWLSRLASCRPAIVLTTVSWLVPYRAAVAGTGPLEDVPWLVPDAISPASARAFREVPIWPDTAALFHFPPSPAVMDEGVTVTHARLLGAEAALSAHGSYRAPWLPLLRELSRARRFGAQRGLVSKASGFAADRADLPAA